MADTLSMGLLELVRKGEVEDTAGFLGEAVRRMAQAIIEAEIEQVIGAGRYERSEARTNPLCANIEVSRPGSENQ